MSYGKAAGAYLENDILARSKEGLVVLLYEHLVLNLKKAKFHIERREIELKEKAVVKSMDIVFELGASLDKEHGGELANRLASLYVYFNTEIAQASRTLSAKRLDKTIILVEELAGAWRQAETLGAGKASGVSQGQTSAVA